VLGYGLTIDNQCDAMILADPGATGAFPLSMVSPCRSTTVATDTTVLFEKKSDYVLAIR